MKGVTTMHSLGKIRILVATSRIALTLANNIVVVSVEVRILLKLLGLKSIYSEKAIKFCEISTLNWTTVHTVKSKVEILQNFVAFSEYMNFTKVMPNF